MKISIIGAGNVGSLTAMRLCQESLGEVLMVDVVKGIAEGKALDLEDARVVLKYNYSLKGTDDIRKIKDSDITIITAGMPRKPGMTREDLLRANALIVKEICLSVKKLAPKTLLIIVTNPLDLMTRVALRYTGFPARRVFGMGITLDAARFANLISRELDIHNTDIEALVIGTHGEGMLPLPRFTNIKGISLDEFLDGNKIAELVKRTAERGAYIVSLMGSGSAYFAPSAAIAAIVKVIVKNEKRTLGVSAYLNGEYGIKDVCIGVPCRLGKKGIEEIVELALNKQEKGALLKSAFRLKEQFNSLKI